MECRMRGTFGSRAVASGFGTPTTGDLASWLVRDSDGFSFAFSSVCCCGPAAARLLLRYVARSCDKTPGPVDSPGCDASPVTLPPGGCVTVTTGGCSPTDFSPSAGFSLGAGVPPSVHFRPSAAFSPLTGVGGISSILGIAGALRPGSVAEVSGAPPAGGIALLMLKNETRGSR